MNPSFRWLRGAALCLAAVAIFVPWSGSARAADPQAPWLVQGQPTRQARQLLSAARQAETVGLSNDEFAPLLRSIDAQSTEASIHELATQFIRRLHDGRVDPRAAGYALGRRRAPVDVDAAARRLATSDDVFASLAAFEPQSSQYRALKQALARYRAMRTDLNTLPALPGRSVREGESYAGSAKLRGLLAALGDAPEPADAADGTETYDADLAAAIARFQRRHGLTADGVLGGKTFAALTVPVAQRIRQIELTMERWRWLPEIEPPAVIVNVPQYMLYALPDPRHPAAEPARIPVIVGKSVHRTPVFDSVIESVVIRPYWNVPTSILRNELLPAIRRDPAYLERHDMEIVRGAGDDAAVLAPDEAGIAALESGKARLRQRPGPRNSLGLVKFNLPNPYSVYLHSTPEASLFSRDRRAFSHGCVRVSDAIGLAAYLLEGTPGDWDEAAIDAATCGTKTFTIRLARPVPIFILYGTVVIDSNGEVLFFEDVYGYDRKLDVLLKSRPASS